MTADTLRRAATLMRERADAVDDRDYTKRIVAKVGRRTPSGQHIAGMTPSVAAVLADWLDMQAGCVQNYGPNAESLWVKPHTQMALAVARAYLGEES